MKDLTEYINEHSSHRIYSQRDMFKMFDYVRNKINNDDIFIELICRSIIDNKSFNDVMYDIIDNQHINIPNKL